MNLSGKVTACRDESGSRKPTASLGWLFGAISLAVLCVLRVDDVMVAWINNKSAIRMAVCLLTLPSADSDAFRQTTSLIPSNGSPCFDASPATAMNAYLRGMALMGSGDLDGGRRALEESIEIGFRSDLASLWLGDLAASQGDLPRAVDYWVESGAGSVFLARARASLAVKDIEDTSLYLSVLLRFFDRLEPGRVRETANLYQALGDHYLKEKAYSDAASAYYAVLQCAPSRHYVRVRLARIYRDQLDRPNEAMREFERTIELGDEQWQAIAYGELGYTYLLLGQTERAIPPLQASTSMNQGLARPHYYLGQVFQQQGNLSLACEQYERALQLDPDAREIDSLYDQYCASTP